MRISGNEYLVKAKLSSENKIPMTNGERVGCFCPVTVY